MLKDDPNAVSEDSLQELRQCIAHLEQAVQHLTDDNARVSKAKNEKLRRLKGLLDRPLASCTEDRVRIWTHAIA